MDFSKEQITHLATLARLRLQDDEIAQHQANMSAILDYVHKLQELDTKNVPPTTHAVELTQGLRKDLAIQHLTHEDALRNAPDIDQGQFRVPKVVS